MGRTINRVHRCPAPISEDATARRPDFACAYEMRLPAAADGSSLHWARAVWEGAPILFRWVLILGWRLVLGLRMGPLDSPGHVLGWTIEQTTTDRTTCHLDSRLLDARNAFTVQADTLTWTTTVLYRHPVARIIWPPVSLAHRLLVRLALRGAAKRSPHSNG